VVICEAYVLLPWPISYLKQRAGWHLLSIPPIDPYAVTTTPFLNSEIENPKIHSSMLRGAPMGPLHGLPVDCRHPWVVFQLVHCYLSCLAIKNLIAWGFHHQNKDLWGFNQQIQRKTCLPTDLPPAVSKLFTGVPPRSKSSLCAMTLWLKDFRDGVPGMVRQKEGELQGDFII